MPFCRLHFFTFRFVLSLRVYSLSYSRTALFKATLKTQTPYSRIETSPSYGRNDEEREKENRFPGITERKRLVLHLSFSLFAFLSLLRKLGPADPFSVFFLVRRKMNFAFF